jgi:hypothetical protein
VSRGRTVIKTMEEIEVAANWVTKVKDKPTEKWVFFLSIPLGGGKRNRANLDIYKQIKMFFRLDNDQGDMV